MTIGQRIKELREQKRWSQKQLAAKVEVTQQAINNWERGANGPNPTQRESLSKAFEITEAELFGGIASKISPEILAALQDPIAVKALLITFKNSQDIKNTIKALLETLPNLTSEKRRALLALCK
jgi:transcriptional regulator with XRE-family HTH domain